MAWYTICCWFLIVICQQHFVYYFDLIFVYWESWYFTIRVKCLNLWHSKSLHLNTMKLTAFTKLGLKMLYIKFLNNRRICSYIINFKMKEHLIFSRFIHDWKYIIYFKIESMCSIYSYYLLYTNIVIYQKSYVFI